MKLNGSTTTLLTEGMGGRLKRKGGQLVPLKQRLNNTELKKRVEKMAARRTVAEQLFRQQENFMMGIVQALNGYFNRGFFGRWKMLLAGK
jgi:hypothetical protein